MRLDKNSQGRQLSEFLRINSSYKCRRALKQVIGDGMLYDRNPIYRRVRDLSVNLGVRFVPASKIPSYTEWPLLLLSTIVKKRIVPYHENLKAFKALEQIKPGLFTLNDADALGPKTNYILHESTHIIAEKIWHDFFARQGQTSRRRKSFYLRHLFSESCANATELYSNIFAIDEYDEFSLNVNNYFFISRKDRSNLREVLTFLKKNECMQMLIFFFLRVNYLTDSLSSGELKRISGIVVPGAHFSKRHMRILMNIYQITNRLNLRFRSDILRIYFRYMGVEGDAIKFLTQERSRLNRHLLKIAPLAQAYANMLLSDQNGFTSFLLQNHRDG